MKNMKYRKDLKDKARVLRTNQTGAEKKLWGCLRKKRFLGLQFYRQRPIGSYIVDFYCPKISLVIEVDGCQHHEERKEYDERRTVYLEELGLNILRVDNIDVNNNLSGVLDGFYRYASKFIEQNFPGYLECWERGEDIILSEYLKINPSLILPLGKGETMDYLIMH